MVILYNHSAAFPSHCIKVGHMIMIAPLTTTHPVHYNDRGVTSIETEEAVAS